MSKILLVDFDKCHWCRVCETGCSMMSEIKTSISNPRITAVALDLDGFGMPIICHQCQDAPCMAVCPKDAVYRDEDLNRIMVNYDRCIGCRLCMTMCPFGAMDFDGETGRVVKCDLCDGDPLCAKLCSYGAILSMWM